MATSVEQPLREPALPSQPPKQEMAGPRILFARNMTPTCELLLDTVVRAFRNDGSAGCDVVDASSVQDACAALSELSSGDDGFDVVFVCLDLPPAPTAGARLAADAQALGLAVVLVTRSLRWLPARADHLRKLAWVRPEASEEDVRQAILEAKRQAGGSQRHAAYPAVGPASVQRIQTVPVVPDELSIDEDDMPSGTRPSHPFGLRPPPPLASGVKLASTGPELGDEDRPSDPFIASA